MCQFILYSYCTVHHGDIMSQEIIVRKVNYPINEQIPRLFWNNRPVKTHFVNALNVLFPEGERWFVRILSKAAKKVGDPKIRKIAKNFAGQEMAHSVEHDKFLSLLKDHYGYDTEVVENALSWLFKTVEEHLPLEVSTSVIAGIEHFTALIGNIALEDEQILDELHPTVKELLRWHAAEEIEHKAAAFDVHAALNDSYLLRSAGMVIAALGVYGFITYLIVDLTQQDRKLFTIEALEDAIYLFFGEHQLFPRTFFEFIKYFIPGFHPNDVDDYHLAEKVFNEMQVKAG